MHGDTISLCLLVHVCSPGLHITVGICLRLFVDCRGVVLDAVSDISYEKYCEALVTKRELMDEMVALQDTIQCFKQHVIYMLSIGEEGVDTAEG